MSSILKKFFQMLGEKFTNLDKNNLLVSLVWNWLNNLIPTTILLSYEN
jgi:hypothetical protein